MQKSKLIYLNLSNNTDESMTLQYNNDYTKQTSAEGRLLMLLLEQS